MNDKDLLEEDKSDKLEEKSALDATPNETDLKPNNETGLTSGISSKKKEATEAEAKPKRKYTKKATAKPDDTVQTEKPSESKNEGETLKPKRTYTKKESMKKNDSQDDGTKDITKTTSKKTTATRKKSSPQPESSESFENSQEKITITNDSSEAVNESAPTTTEEVKESKVDNDTVQSIDLTEDTQLSDLRVDGEFQLIPELFPPDLENDFDTEYAPEKPLVDEAIDYTENRILPPDELFADRHLGSEAPTETETPSESADEEEFFDAPMDEDGQYRFAELEEADDEPILPAPNDPLPEKYDPKKPRRIDGRFDILELFVFTLLTVMIITSFFFRHSIVEGESMENTLHSGEHLIISDLFYTPKRGDIVVCEDYTTAIPKPIVKRVIAVAGDTIEIKKNGNVYINGVLLEEDYVNIDDPSYEYKELTVKLSDGELFVMGDHRNKSTDSREIGTVSEDSVLGKVLIRFYPFDKFGTVK